MPSNGTHTSNITTLKKKRCFTRLANNDLIEQWARADIFIPPWAHATSQRHRYRNEQHKNNTTDSNIGNKPQFIQFKLLSTYSCLLLSSDNLEFLKIMSPLLFRRLCSCKAMSKPSGSEISWLEDLARNVKAIQEQYTALRSLDE